MHFNVWVFRVPFVQFAFRVRAPEDRAVQQPRVVKAIWQTAQVYGTAFAKVVDRHLHFLVPAVKHRRAGQGVHVFLALAKVDFFFDIGRNKVFLGGRPVILVVV